MPKFYVESGPARCVIDANDAEEAAINALQWFCEMLDRVQAPELLAQAAVISGDVVELHEKMRVSEQGFGRSDAQVFDTLDVVAAWQGYSFPWC